eukprot:TRINITY_DN6643_c0_g1_i7.p1 TRINITY_DN6643_c0_g1~~TRINITY_DN6643_c0_g1_i7.p1  ORF type:complete len:208 (+),score=27.81 TRINITY_DN6643_c0_g1_i7:143-766(+)
MQPVSNQDDRNIEIQTLQINVRSGELTKAITLQSAAKSEILPRAGTRDSNVSKTRQADYTSEDHLHTDTSVNNKSTIGPPAQDIVELKAISIIFDVREKAGEEWKVVSTTAKAIHRISDYKRLLNQNKPKFWQSLLTLFVLFCSCGLFIWNMLTSRIELNLALLVFGAAYTAFCCRKLYHRSRETECSPYFAPCYTWALPCYCTMKQ